MANLTATPTWVIPQRPIYPVIITRSDSFKKDYQLLDTDAIERFNLRYDGVSDADRNSILSQFSGVSGPYANFVWNCVPSYLNAGTTMTVRYVPGSYKETPRETYWEISFTLEKDV